MVAHVLPSDTNITAIMDGRRHALLVRASATQPDRIGGPGALLHLRTARSKGRAAHYLPAARCVLRATVHLNACGVVRVVGLAQDGSGAHDGRARDRAQTLGFILVNAEQASASDRDRSGDRLAAALGHKDYAALWADIRTGDDRVITRELIAWVLA